MRPIVNPYVSGHYHSHSEYISPLYNGNKKWGSLSTPTQTPMATHSPMALDELSQIIHSPGSLDTLTPTRNNSAQLNSYKYEYNSHNDTLCHTIIL